MRSSGLDSKQEVAMDLDVSKHYSYVDKKEVRWVFAYQTIASDEGWFVWRTAPGQIEICVGKTTEKEVIDAVTKNPPLTQDDLIDLELWIINGGLDKYNPKI